LNAPPYNPPNVQQPHPPILVGGGGEKKTLRIVAKYADATNVSGTPEEVKHKFEVLAGHCRDIGRDPSTIRRTIQVPLFMTDDEAFRQRVLTGMSAALGSTPEEAARSLLIGSVDEIKAKVQEFVDAGVQEFMLALWPRFHRDSLLRFSKEVIPAFR
jgi:alkanesulfonate monooxygenase SsuD/methylene tetrahydromethanopterin reductase-like flavin-dependent oxidoreductase (luciferase family)